MRFWNDRDLEPKRNFKWRLSFTGESPEVGIAEYIAKSAQRPTKTVEVAEHKYFNHTFKYPGSVTWEPIDLVIVDPITVGAAGRLEEIVKSSGYNLPNDSDLARQTISKSKAVDAIGGIKLTQIDSDDNQIDTYTLANPWISSVEYSEFSYEDDELTEITITVEYDFAEIVDQVNNKGNT